MARGKALAPQGESPMKIFGYIIMFGYIGILLGMGLVVTGGWEKTLIIALPTIGWVEMRVGIFSKGC